VPFVAPLQGSPVPGIGASVCVATRLQELQAQLEAASWESGQQAQLAAAHVSRAAEAELKLQAAEGQVLALSQELEAAQAAVAEVCSHGQPAGCSSLALHPAHMLFVLSAAPPDTGRGLPSSSPRGARRRTGELRGQGCSCAQP
jgi:hypothetical protein